MVNRKTEVRCGKGRNHIQQISLVAGNNRDVLALINLLQKKIYVIHNLLYSSASYLL